MGKISITINNYFLYYCTVKQYCCVIFSFGSEFKTSVFFEAFVYNSS